RFFTTRYPGSSNAVVTILIFTLTFITPLLRPRCRSLSPERSAPYASRILWRGEESQLKMLGFAISTASLRAFPPFTSPPPESPHLTDTPSSSRSSASPSDNPPPSPQKYSAQISADSGRSPETTCSAPAP